MKYLCMVLAVVFLSGCITGDIDGDVNLNPVAGDDTAVEVVAEGSMVGNFVRTVAGLPVDLVTWITGLFTADEPDPE